VIHFVGDLHPYFNKQAEPHLDVGHACAAISHNVSWPFKALNRYDLGSVLKNP
jgi:hypothetical protein